MALVITLVFSGVLGAEVFGEEFRSVYIIPVVVEHVLTLNRSSDFEGDSSEVDFVSGEPSCFLASNSNVKFEMSFEL